MAEPKDFSEHTARLIDEEIQALVRDMESKAEHCLRQQRGGLDVLAHALLEHETLEAEDVERLLQQEVAALPAHVNGQKAVSRKEAVS